MGEGAVGARPQADRPRRLNPGAPEWARSVNSPVMCRCLSSFPITILLPLFFQNYSPTTLPLYKLPFYPVILLSLFYQTAGYCIHMPIVKKNAISCLSIPDNLDPAKKTTDQSGTNAICTSTFPIKFVFSQVVRHKNIQT